MRSLRPQLSLSHISRYARSTQNNTRCLSPTVKRLCSCTASRKQNERKPPYAVRWNLPEINASISIDAQNLYQTSSYSPGSPLFNPDGAFVFNRLIEFLRAQHGDQGYNEVITPTMYKKSLWETSGHWENYAKDMFQVVGHGATGTTENAEVGEDEEFGLKPMNCPGHCVLFANRTWSYKELPVRFADFSPLHRNENSGSLRGLTRVRRFHQDDGHIFCTPAQIKSEILKELAFVRMVYKTFDMPGLQLALSTKPTDGSAIGTSEQWDTAESHLEEALNNSGLPWTVKPGDGAFYGPKIDIMLPDHSTEKGMLQAATIQLDFQLPERFSLAYKDAEQKVQRPVMIHRAAFGSIERFMHLIMTRREPKPPGDNKYPDKARPLPFWLTPKPAIIMTIKNTPELVDYALGVQDVLRGHASEPPGRPQPLNQLLLPIAVDTRAISVGLKMREAKAKGYHFGVVLGDKELGTKTLDLTAYQRPEVFDQAYQYLRVQDQGVSTNTIQESEGRSTGDLRVSGRPEKPMQPEQCRSLFEMLYRHYV